MRKLATALANSPRDYRVGRRQSHKRCRRGNRRRPTSRARHRLRPRNAEACGDDFIPAAVLASFAPVGLAARGAGRCSGGRRYCLGRFKSFKKSNLYVTTVKALGPVWDDLLDRGEAQAVRLLLQLVPFRNFVSANEAPLRRIAEKTTQLRWALRYIDFIQQTNSDGNVLPAGR